MPTPPHLAVYSERSKSKNLPPPSPAAVQARHQTNASAWSRIRSAGPFQAGAGSRSRSNSDVDSSHGGPSKASSLVGGGSLTPSKAAGGVGAGAGAGGGIGGGGGGGGGDEDGKNRGRYAYAFKSYDSVNKPRPYWDVAAEVVAKGATMPKKRLVPLLRELCIRIGDSAACDGAFFGVLLTILRSAKDGDWDGKVVRLVHFFVRGMITVEGDTEGNVLGSHWEGRGISSRQILQAVECFRDESEHHSAARRIPAFYTLATLCQLASDAKIGGQPTPVEVLKESTIAPLRSFQAQERPDKEGKGKGRAHRQRVQAFQESLQVSASIFSAIRRCPTLARDLSILPAVMLGCCNEHPAAARHAFAILAEQAAQSAEVVSQTLLSKAMLVPTTVGMLQVSGGLASSGQEPNLADPLACVYYLRAIKALAFAETLDDTMRLDMYRTLVSSVSDARHRVALEAMQCLLEHPRAWELLVNAQRQSRDANIFRRVVDRIKVCVEEATAPATAGDTAAAGETEKLAGSSTVSGVSGRPESLTSGSSTKKGKGKAKADAGAGTGDAPCNWALAHAACRVCRVVGRTFQVAISYQTIQSQNRASIDGSRSPIIAPTKSTAVSTSSSGARPPSISTRHGFGEASAEGGDDNQAMPEDTGSGGVAFNLLGLPPSPAPKSGATGASAWGSLEEGGTKGVGDVMAGQVVDEQNTAAIRDLCRTLQQHKLLESPHLHVRSLALEAMFLLVPDPSPLDPQLRGLWDWLQQRVEQCPSTLPDSVLSELVDTLLTRVQCSAASREEVIPIALALTESFMYQVPSEEMGRCVLRAWCQCVEYGGRARETVLQSVYRVLDRNIALPRETPSAAGSAHDGWDGVDSTGRGSSRHVRGLPSEDWTRQTDAPQPPEENNAPRGMTDDDGIGGAIRSGGVGNPRGVSTILGGEEAFRWGKTGTDTGASVVSRKMAYLKAKSATTRVKRSAFWFLGEYCCQLTGTSADALGSPARLNRESSPPPAASTSNDLLDVWASSSTSVRSGLDSGGEAGGLDGEGAVGVRVVAHPVVAAMNGATVSIILRLKHAAMFEDYQTRYTCASALCKVALRLPDPVRFDAYCFLKGLADAADMFPLVPPQEGSGTAQGSSTSVEDEDPLEFHRREQEALSEKFESASAYGIGEVVAPVLDYLGCFYSAAEGKKEKGGEKSAVSPRQTREEEFLDMYRHLLDGQGAAPGP